jgi:hypothetical protein
MRLLSIFIFLIFLFSCKHNDRDNVNNYPLVLLNDPGFNAIRTKLESPNDDSATNHEFIVSYRKNRWCIKDTKHRWENQYSEGYEGIVVKSYTKDNVLIFCPYSGIVEGYKIFPHKFHDMYLLDRKNGATKKHIIFQGGLGNALIYKGAVYIQFDSLEIHKCVY